MMATKSQKLAAIDGLAKGLSFTAALRSCKGYSESTAVNAAMRVFASKSFKRLIRTYVDALFEFKDETPVATQLALIRAGSASISEIRTALHECWTAWHGNVPLTAVELAEIRPAPVKRSRKQQALNPRVQAEIQVLREKARALQPGDIGMMATARLGDELLTPADDGRTRISAIRLGLERDGLVGNNPAAQHLHLHRHDGIPAFETLPLSVQRLLSEKMLDLLNAKRTERGLLPLQTLPHNPENQFVELENDSCLQVRAPIVAVPDDK